MPGRCPGWHQRGRQPTLTTLRLDLLFRAIRVRYTRGSWGIELSLQSGFETKFLPIFVLELPSNPGLCRFPICYRFSLSLLFSRIIIINNFSTSASRRSLSFPLSLIALIISELWDMFFSREQSHLSRYWFVALSKQPIRGKVQAHHIAKMNMCFTFSFWHQHSL